MSTAGKVLVVLVTLTLLVWLGLLSMVAQLNSNWGQEVVKLEKQIKSAEDEVQKLRADVAKVKDDFSRMQVARGEEVIVLRSLIADREKTLTETNETLARAQNQVKGQQASEEKANLAKKLRTEEKAETEKALAEERETVKKLMDENKELMAQLGKLQKDFIATLAENKKLLVRVSQR